MATEKLTAGTQSSYTSWMTTELNSLASGNAVLSSSSISNGSNDDLAIELSFTTGGSITPSGSPFIAVYLYPVNGDGSTIGDGRFSSAAAGPPPSNYYRGFCGMGTSAGTQTGTFAVPGTSIFQIPLPRGTFYAVFYNLTGVTLSSSGNILYYRTTNRSVA